LGKDLPSIKVKKKKNANAVRVTRSVGTAVNEEQKKDGLGKGDKKRKSY